MAQQFTGKTVEDAVKEALKVLNLTEENAEITILEEPTKGGFFGIGSKPAKISVCKKKADGKRTVDFLEEIIKLLSVTATAEITEDSEEKLVINLIATDSSSLIGFRGEVLDSLQSLAGAVANIDKNTYRRVVVNCENYREKREETLTNLAKRLADKAVKTSRKLTLEPMNPFERRVIHSALIGYEGVKTLSEGKEPNRFVSIIPDGYDPTKHREPRFKNGEGRNDRHSNNGRGRGDFKGGDRGFDKNRNGQSRNGDKRNGFRKEAPAPKSKSIGFGGVFLGNSLKNNEDAPKKESNEE